MNAPPAPGRHTLYGRLGSGSGACEALLALSGTAFDLVEFERWSDGKPPAELLAVNPLGQVPTLVMPDGAVVTESAAICMTIADAFPAAGLAPSITDPARPTYLRWMVYLAANIYMTTLKCYYPHRYVDGGDAGAVKIAADRRLDVEWSVFADALRSPPFMIGNSLSAVDVYAAMLMSWHDDLPALRRRHAGLNALYLSVANHPVIVPVWSRHGIPD